ncbi:DUF2127 domain-containing protein [Actinokineospora soli]|uniref:DUF2127 domain-containing protein n=1 Tax=Actinokineospora soli TaxID=1048753 RepID=A0ABW2TIB7_9PSEU
MFFRLLMVLKGADGALQVLGGLLLALVPPSVITGLANAVITRDLVGDVNGTLAHHLSKAAQHFADGSTRVFAIGFLLAHGVVKLGLVAAMLRRRLSAYPIAAVLLAVFIVFEVARAARTGSIALPVFAAFDVLVLVMVLREFARLQAERRASRISGP